MDGLSFNANCPTSACTRGDTCERVSCESATSTTQDYSHGFTLIAPRHFQVVHPQPDIVLSVHDLLRAGASSIMAQPVVRSDAVVLLTRMSDSCYALTSLTGLHPRPEETCLQRVARHVGAQAKVEVWSICVPCRWS